MLEFCEDLGDCLLTICEPARGVAVLADAGSPTQRVVLGPAAEDLDAALHLSHPPVSGSTFPCLAFSFRLMQ